MTEAQNVMARNKRQVIFFFALRGDNSHLFIGPYTCARYTWLLEFESRIQVTCIVSNSFEFCSAEATTFELPQILAIILVLLSVVLI